MCHLFLLFLSSLFRERMLNFPLTKYPYDALIYLTDQFIIIGKLVIL